MNELPPLTFVIGGAASGKSNVAEALILEAKDTPFYIATGQAFDSEMTNKIEQHKAARSKHGWTTIEEPVNITAALARVPDDAVVLLDCATMWLTNIVLAEADVEAETEKLLATLNEASQSIVIVSNETGHGIVPENALARRFRQEQGILNQKLAAQADLVVQVTVGLPQVLKGKLPKGNL